MTIFLFVFLWWLIGFIAIMAYTLFEFFFKDTSKKDFTLNDLLIAVAVGVFGPVALLLAIGFFAMDMWEILFGEKKYGDVVLFRKKD